MHPWTGFTFLSVNYSHFKHDSVQSEAPSEATDPCENVIKMAIIKEASEDIKIEETFRVKQEDRRGELRKRGEKSGDLLINKIQNKKDFESKVKPRKPELKDFHTYIHGKTITALNTGVDIHRG